MQSIGTESATTLHDSATEKRQLVVSCKLLTVVCSCPRTVYHWFDGPVDNLCYDTLKNDGQLVEFLYHLP